MSRYELEMELPLEKLAQIFKDEAWLYASGDCYGVPGPAELKGQICKLAMTLEKEEGLALVAGGRIAVALDPLSDGGYEVFLSVGYLSPIDEEVD